MAGKWVYPKRTDGVFAICFDGSQVSALEIASALDLVVRHRISLHEESVLEISALDPIKPGQYVIIDDSHDLVEVIDYDAYHDKYTDK